MIPFSDSKFHLDVSGVAGFFGGEEAISAMATVQLYKGRKWLGWYNSPGSYTVAKRYGQIARSRFWNGLFPGVAVDPAVVFGLGGKKGPQYFGAYSGTRIADTGHIGSLVLEMCRNLEAKDLGKGRDNVEPERYRSQMTVTMVELPARHAPAKMIPLELEERSALIAGFPSLFSAGACAATGYFHDWFSFSMILLGMLSTGFSCLAVGSGKHMFTHPVPASTSPPGHGFLLESNKDVVVLLGTEGVVNCVTRGRFLLQYSNEPVPENRIIGVAALLLNVQFLLQLILIPQGTLFGQLLFLSTFAVSWVYNCYLSSIDIDEIQQQILTKQILRAERKCWRRYTVGSWTAMAVFVLHAIRPPDVRMARKVLDALIPNESADWESWKEVVAQKVVYNLSVSVFDHTSFDSEIEVVDGLLQTLYQDAEYVRQSYEEVFTQDLAGCSKETV